MGKMALVCTLLLAAGPALGATITQTLNFSGTPDFAQPLTFDQFNVPGATLQSIHVYLSLDVWGGALRVDNDALTSASGDVYFGAQADVTSSVSMVDGSLQAIFQPGSIQATGTKTFNLAPDDLDNEVGGTANFSTTGADYDVYTGAKQSASHDDFVNSTAWSQYIGNGTFTVTIAASQATNYSSLGGVQAQIDPLTASGTFRVDYNYTPEPATMCLVLLGGLGLLRRRVNG